MSIRLAIVDDQGMVRAGFRSLLAGEEDIAPALQQQARQEKSRIVIPGSAVPDYGAPPTPGHEHGAGCKH